MIKIKIIIADQFFNKNKIITLIFNSYNENYFFLISIKVKNRCCGLNFVIKIE